MYSKVIATLEEASDTRNEQGMINIEKLRALWRVSILNTFNLAKIHTKQMHMHLKWHRRNQNIK